MQPRILVIAVASLCSAAACAQGAGPSGEHPPPALVVAAGGAPEDFRALDRNEDGYISPQEAEQHEALATQWDEADQNQDDRLDRAEFAAFMARQEDKGGG